MEKYYAVIDELVENENKIVSYKSLSNQLALPVVEAKQILTEYIKKKKEISVVYALTGRTKCGVLVQLVKDEDLNLAKSKLLNLIYCSPYSVQKCKPTCTTLYLTDYDVIKENPYQSATYGGIYFNGGKRLSSAEYQEIKKLMRNSHNKDVLTMKNHNIAKQIKPTKSMFSVKQSIKKEPEIEKKAPVKADINAKVKIEKIEEKKTLSKKPSSGMQAFMAKGKIDLFAKQIKEALPEISATSQAKIPEENSKGSSKEVVKSPPTDLLDEITHNTSFNKDDETTKKMVDKKTTIKKSSTKKPHKKQNQLKSNAITAKKRKRIQELSSSSEEENEEMDFNDDVIPASPSLVKKRPLSPKTSVENPKKRRVLKSHTYTTDDGSMLTEKVWEEIPCSSDSDNNEKPAVATKKKQSTLFEKKTKPEIMKKGKQSTLMGFFKKKT